MFLVFNPLAVMTKSSQSTTVIINQNHG